jgi:hypothetical protein
MALILIVLVVPLAFGATLTWTSPTYTDNTVVPASLAATIVYTPYSGPSATGPWTAGTNTAAGVLTATMPDPGAGGTLWYTVDATLPGTPTSPKAVPASKTILKGIGAPAIISIQ